MSLRSLLAVTVVAVCAAASAAPAQASVAFASPFQINYAVTLPDYPVSAIVMFEAQINSSYGLTWVFDAPTGTSTLTDPFTKLQPIAANFLMGLTENLASDPVVTDPNTGDLVVQRHLVLFTNDSFAAGAQGIAFGTLFPTTSEATLINDLVTAFAFNSNPSQPALDAAVNDLFTFANGDATSGPSGSIAFGSASTFTAVAFSAGQTIGTGHSFTTPVRVDAVPEPASLTLLGAGLLAMMRLRRRGRVAAAAPG